MNIDKHLQINVDVVKVSVAIKNLIENNMVLMPLNKMKKFC